MPISNTVRAAAGDFRRMFPQLLAYTVLFRAFSAVVIGPVSAWTLSALVASTGRRALGNEEILRFVLSPAGMTAVLLSASVGLAALFGEQAGILLLAADSVRGNRPRSGVALLRTVRVLPSLLNVGVRQTVIYALTAAPFVAVAGGTYELLLSGHDINYYLDGKPPQFLAALAIGALLGLGLAVVWGWLFFRWVFAVPARLFEDKRGGDALKRSRLLTRGRTLRLAGLLLGFNGAVLGTAALLLGGLRLVGDPLLSLLGDRPSLVIPAAGGLLALAAVLAAAFSMFGSVGTWLLAAREYVAAREKAGDLVPSEVPSAADQWEPSRPVPLRLILWVSAAAVFVLTIGTSWVIVESLDLEDRVAVTAHRAGCRKAPENTVSAIRQAIADGADFAEIDVQETADGVIVLLHDKDLMRIAGVSRNIWEINYDELEGVDVGSSFSRQFKGEPIATLAQAMEAAGNRIKLNIELKYNGHDERLAERTVEVIRQQDFASRCVVTSLGYDGLMAAKAADEDVRVGYIVARAVGDLWKLDVDFLSVATDLADDALLEDARRRGRPVHVWTVNDRAEMQVFIERGVDNIITDEPDVLIQLLKDRAAMSDTEKILLKLRLWLK